MARESILPKKLSHLLPLLLILLTLPLLLLFSSSSLPFPHPPSRHPPSKTPLCAIPTGNLTRGHWTQTPHYKTTPNSLYNSSCKFHRNAWNCLRNARENMEKINSWVWIPEEFGGSKLPRFNPAEFLSAMRGRRLGFVGDSLNENLVVALLCALGSADGGARRWKGRGAWRGGFFPGFDVTVGYHRAVLLAKFV